MIDSDLPEPKFEQKQIDGALVRVTLSNDHNMRKVRVDTGMADIVGVERANTLNDLEKRIINFVAEHGRINTSQAMNLMPKPRWHTAKSHLDNLVEGGLLVHVSRFSRDATAYLELATGASTKPPANKPDTKN